MEQAQTDDAFGKGIISVGAGAKVNRMRQKCGQKASVQMSFA